MPHLDVLPLQWLLPIALVGYVLIALYVYAPLKVRRNQTKGIDVDFSPTELSEIPLEVSQAFYAGSSGPASNGFETLGALRHDIANTRQNSFVSIWTSRQSNDSAQIIGICTPSPTQGLKAVTLVTFRTEFRDGTSIVTSNSTSASCFPADRRVSSIRCPGVWDVGLLYRFHRARVERDRDGRTATLDRVKDPLTRMRLEHSETYERLIRAGYYEIDQARQLYVPTLKGAFLMTWQLLPPFKQIQKLRKDQLAERTLRELGFGGMEAFRRSQSLVPPACKIPNQIGTVGMAVR